MSESYRATLLLVGLTLIISIASWRMVQLDITPARSGSGQISRRTADTTSRPAPPEHQAESPPVTSDRVADLIDAARYGNVGAVLALVSQGVNVNATGEDGLTPLLAAISQRSATPELIDKLLRAGADGTAKDPNGRDALGLAVDKDDVNIIGALLKHSRKLAGEASSALCDAAAQNHIESIKFLLDNHVDANKADKQGRTPLLSAIKQGDAETVRYLLEHDADPNKKRADGTTPLMAAVGRANREILQAVLDKAPSLNERNNKGETALVQAVRSKSVELTRALVDAEADVNAADSTGATPLIAAVADDRADLVQMLLDKGADVRAHDNQDATALSIARSAGYSDIIDILTKAGAPDSPQP